MVLEFCIPGQPIPKARPRVTRRGHAFTPKTTLDYERTVRAIAEASRPVLTKEPLRVWIDFYNGDARRRDCDNLAKGVLDALNPRRGKHARPPVVWLDDSQIVVLHVTQQIDRKYPRAVVRIETLGAYVRVAGLPPSSSVAEVR